MDCLFNFETLMQAQADFLSEHPGGFASPEMMEIGKKHKVDKMTAQCQEYFTESSFDDPDTIITNMIKMISRSSMVSMFEKPKFRDYANAMSGDQKDTMALALKNFLYGDQQAGFDAFVDVLKPGKLAKWSLVTILPNYVYPNAEVFVKPTTCKGVIQYFDLPGLQYKPTPSWAFYEEYRHRILQMKSMVDSSLTINNAAFCGFLMMSLKAKA